MGGWEAGSPGVGRLGDWEDWWTGRLGGWESGMSRRLGRWENGRLGRLGGCEVGRLVSFAPKHTVSLAQFH
jgi:hypothetical protein